MSRADSDLGLERPLRQVLVFFAIFIPLTAAAQTALIVVGFGLMVAPVMWSVGVAAMLTMLATRRTIGGLGWKLGRKRYLAIAYVLPLVYGGIAYVAAASAGLAEFPSAERLEALSNSGPVEQYGMAGGVAVLLGLVLTAGFAFSLFTALGEEIGWRGFLTPRLTAASGFLVATIITGALWALWHMPLILLSDYHGGGVRSLEVVSFIVMILATSGAYAWLRLKSGSLWPAAMLHATHNLFTQNVFDPLTARGPSEVTMVGEFGIVFAAVTVIVCAPFWIAGLRLGRGVSMEPVHGG